MSNAAVHHLGDRAEASTTRSERADAITVLIIGAIAVGALAVITTLRALQTFRSDGIGWILPVDQQPIDATIGSGVASIRGYATEALVIVPDVNAVSIAALVTSLTVWALSALLVVSGTMWIAWSFLRGRFFTAGTVRTLGVISWTLAGAPAILLLLDTMARNGILAALHAEKADDGHVTVAWGSLPIVATGIALGLITVALRRGTRLQKETEGLV